MVMSTDRPAMTIAVDLGRKATKQTNLCILMDFLIHIDTITMEMPTVYFKGSYVDVSELCCISVPEGCF